MTLIISGYHKQFKDTKIEYIALQEVCFTLPKPLAINKKIDLGKHTPIVIGISKMLLGSDQAKLLIEKASSNVIFKVK